MGHATLASQEWVPPLERGNVWKCVSGEIHFAHANKHTRTPGSTLDERDITRSKGNLEELGIGLFPFIINVEHTHTHVYTHKLTLTLYTHIHNAGT